MAGHNAKIEGSVVLLATIGTDGLAHDIQVARSLDYGLDAPAVEALKKWTFKPAKSAGKPVPAKIDIENPFPLPGLYSRGHMFQSCMVS